MPPLLLARFLYTRGDVTHGSEASFRRRSKARAYVRLAVFRCRLHRETLALAQSMLTGLRWRHVRLVSHYWSKFTYRTTGGIASLLATLLVGIIIMSALIMPIDMALQKGREAGHHEAETLAQIDKVAKEELVSDTMAFVTGDPRQTEYMLREQPALVSAILVIFLLFFPFVACTAGYNQTAGDIGSKGLRYLLLRTERVNVYVGRFLGACKSLFVSCTILFLVMLVFVGLKFSKIYGFGNILAWVLQGYVACLVLSLPYLALCGWISSASGQSVASLVMCLLAVGIPIIGLKYLNGQIPGDQAWLDRLLPWGWKYDSLSPDMMTRLVAVTVLLAMTAFFLFLGIRAFHRRDL